MGGKGVRVVPAEAARGLRQAGTTVIGVRGREGGEIPVRVRRTGLAVRGERVVLVVLVVGMEGAGERGEQAGGGRGGAG